MRPGQKYLQVRPSLPEITFELGEGAAVELVSFEAGGQRLRCSAEAVDVLSSWAGSVALVVNFGQRSTGKTALLNQVTDLAETQRGFPGGAGAWLWTKPLFNEEENLNTYFIDVAGCGEGLAERFCWLLAFLLGSVLLFSSTEMEWARLGGLARLVEGLSAAEDPAESLYVLSFYAPAFLWLVKGAQPAEADERGLPLSCDAQLERAVLVEGEVIEAQKLFRALFKDKGAFCFARDSAGNAESLKALKERIYSRTRPKLLDGFPLTARMMAALLHALVDCCNEGTRVDFEGLLDTVLAQECQDCLAEALEAHAEELEKLPATRIDARSSDALFALLKAARQRALESFQISGELRERLDTYEAVREKLLAQLAVREQRILEHFKSTAEELAKKAEQEGSGGSAREAAAASGQGGACGPAAPGGGAVPHVGQGRRQGATTSRPAERLPHASCGPNVCRPDRPGAQRRRPGRVLQALPRQEGRSRREDRPAARAEEAKGGNARRLPQKEQGGVPTLGRAAPGAAGRAETPGRRRGHPRQAEGGTRKANRRASSQAEEEENALRLILSDSNLKFAFKFENGKKCSADFYFVLAGGGG